jgi:hypothetical protein
LGRKIFRSSHCGIGSIFVLPIRTWHFRMNVKREDNVMLSWGYLDFYISPILTGRQSYTVIFSLSQRWHLNAGLIIDSMPRRKLQTVPGVCFAGSLPLKNWIRCLKSNRSWTGKRDIMKRKEENRSVIEPSCTFLNRTQ